MSPTEKWEIGKAWHSYNPEHADPVMQDKLRWLGGEFTKAELAAKVHAPTIKNEWVWACPFCGVRNYYLAKYCKKTGCLTSRPGYDAIPFVPSIKKES